jgi:hypothetical protein
MRIRCHRCHQPGTEQPPELVVIQIRVNPQGVTERRIRCECGHEWVTQSKDAEGLPVMRGVVVEYSEAQLPRVYGR